MKRFLANPALLLLLGVGQFCCNKILPEYSYEGGKSVDHTPPVHPRTIRLTKVIRYLPIRQPKDTIAPVPQLPQDSTLPPPPQDTTLPQQPPALPPPPVDIPCTTDGPDVIASLVSNDLPHLGPIFFALDINILPLLQFTPVEVGAAMRLGQYNGNCFYMEVHDVPPGYDMKLDLYAVINGQYQYKKSLDFTSTEVDTTNFGFYVEYTFK